MKLIKTNEITIKKSRFLGFLYEVNDAKEVEEILDILRKEHKKAKHFPYAYIICGSAKKSDDKEPNGTAGLPIYTVLERKKEKNTCIIIIRYFGGIKLGAGGLFRAYMECASKLFD